MRRHLLMPACLSVFRLWPQEELEHLATQVSPGRGFLDLVLGIETSK